MTWPEKKKKMTEKDHTEILIGKLYDAVPCGISRRKPNGDLITCTKGELCSKCKLMKEAASALQLFKTMENIRRADYHE